jgi:hypothetical protein
MAFPTRLLVEGEELVFDLRPHWIALVMPAIATVATLAVMLILYGAFDEPFLDMVVGIAGTLFLLAYPVRKLVDWLTSHFVVTSDRIIHRRGFIAKYSMEVPLEAINDVRFEQGGHRPGHRRRDLGGAIGIGGGPSGVRPHPQARGGPEDDLPPG